MKRAPPTVPGMPSAYSSPESPRATAARARRPNRTAAPALTSQPPAPRTPPPPPPRRGARRPPPASPRSPGPLRPPPAGSSRRRGGSRARRAPSRRAAPRPARRANREGRAGRPARRCGGKCAARAARPPGSVHRAGTRGPSRALPGSPWSVDGDGRSGAQQLQELVRTAVDVARAEREHEIAGSGDGAQRIGDAVTGGDVAHVEVTATTESLEERLSRHGVDAGLAGGVDVGEEQDVGVVERLQEIAEEIPGARVPVGLEGDH